MTAKRASLGLQRSPPGSGLPRANSTRGKNGACVNSRFRGSSVLPRSSFPGFAGMQTRRFGGFCYSGVLGSASRDGAVHAADCACRVRLRDGAIGRKRRSPH